MIEKKTHPESWAYFMTELEDAQEHLAVLIRELHQAGSVDGAELSVDLGHVYAHLNRAWYRHRLKTDFPEEEWKEASAYPSDLHPVG